MRAGDGKREQEYLYCGADNPCFVGCVVFFRKREQEKNIVGACRSHCHHHHHQKSCCMWLGAAANLVGVVSVCCELFRLRYTFLDFFGVHELNSGNEQTERMCCARY